MSALLLAPGRARVRSARARTFLAALAALLPWRARRFVHVRLLGHDLHPTARIGRSVVDVEHLVMGENAKIGSLDVIRGCQDVVLEDEAVILSLVWVNAVRRDRGYFAGQDRHPALIMRYAALITTFHLLDACDRIEFAPFGSLAGFGSVVQTHAADIERVRQACAPVYVGDHAMVASRATLLPGAVVPDASIIAAGAVVTGPLRAGPQVYGGVPAKPLRAVDPDGPFFTRTITHLW